MLSLTVGKNKFWIGVRIFEHQLCVNEEDKECERHQNIVPAEMDHNRFLEINLDVNVAPHLNDQFKAN